MISGQLEGLYAVEIPAAPQPSRKIDQDAWVRRRVGGRGILP